MRFEKFLSFSSDFEIHITVISKESAWLLHKPAKCKLGEILAKKEAFS